MTTAIKNIEPDEEEIADNARFHELNRKQDRSEEENEELTQLKQRYGERVNKRIGSYKAREAQAKEEAERYRRELEELKNSQKPPTKPVFTGEPETVEIDGSKYYTNKALRQMVEDGKMTNEEAYDHQESRIEAQAVAKAVQRISKQTEQATWQQQAKEDADKVLAKYPQFSPSHPDHDPNDPVYRKATELWNDGLKSSARGLSKAVELAEQLLNKKSPDVSGNLNDFRPTAPVKNEQDKTELTAEEKDAAYRMYVMNAMTNPRTRKPYTEKEAYEVALEAKKNRKSRRIQ